MIDPHDPRLTAYVLGELSKEEAADIEHFVEDSPELARVIAEIRQTTAQLQEEFAHEDALTLRSEQRQALRERAERSTLRPSSQLKSVILNHWAWAVVGSAACVMVAITWLPSWDASSPRRTTASVPPQDEQTSADFDSLQAIVVDDVMEESETATEGEVAWRTAAESRNGTVELQQSNATGWEGRVLREEKDNVAVDLESELLPVDTTNVEDSFQVQVPELASAEESAPFTSDGKFLSDAQVEMIDATDSWLGGTAGEVERAKTSAEQVESRLDVVVEDEVGESEQRFEDRRAGQYGDVDRLFDVEINRKSTVMDLVAPGDKVDAIVRPNDDPAGEARDELAVLEGATVHSVAKGEDRSRVSFAVNEEQRRRLELAEQLAPIELQLKRPNDGRPTEEVTTEELTERLAKHERQRDRAEKPRSWRRVKANPNTSRLMIGDHQELAMKGMQVNVQVDGFRARVLVDCFYFNDQNQQLEGTFKLRLPDDASLFYFAFGESVYDLTTKGGLTQDEFRNSEMGTQPVALRVDHVRQTRRSTWQNVKEARLVTKEKAAFAYQQTVRRRVDPALVEWSGAGVFNARVFPLMPRKLHRIVIGYDVNLEHVQDAWHYTLQLPDELREGVVDINIRHSNGSHSEMASRSTFRAVKTRNGKHYRSDQPIAGDTIQVSLRDTGDVFLKSDDESEGGFFASRVTLELPQQDQANRRRAVFLVDTSLSSQPDKFNVWLDLLRKTLDNNRDSIDEFAVLFFNVENHYWLPQYSANTAENVRRLTNDCQQLVLEGATDLHSALQTLAETAWLQTGSKPDLFLLSDGAANWGETNLRLMEQIVTSHDLGSVFAYQTGLNGTAISDLRFLSSATGGAVFSVANEDEIAAASRAHRSRPWRLVEMECDEATDLLTAGRIQWVYPGQPITIVGRLESGAVVGPIRLKLERGDERIHLSVVPDAEVESELASRLYGQVAVGQLESLGQNGGRGGRRLRSPLSRHRTNMFVADARVRRRLPAFRYPPRGRSVCHSEQGGRRGCHLRLA